MGTLRVDAAKELWPRDAVRAFGHAASDSRLIGWDAALDACHGHGIRLMLIDTGLDWALPAFRDSAVEYIDFTGTGAGGDPCGHGTRNASMLMGSASGEQQGLAGGIALTVAKAVGAGMRPVARALRWAALHRVPIVALPFGRLMPDPAIDEALEALRRAGTRVYAAAGNRGPDMLLYPARRRAVVAVTGADHDGGILDECYAGAALDIIAPGLVRCPLDGRAMRGSSVAAVIAAGVHALELEFEGGCHRPPS